MEEASCPKPEAVQSGFGKGERVGTALGPSLLNKQSQGSRSVAFELGPLNHTRKAPRTETPAGGLRLVAAPFA